MNQRNPTELLGFSRTETAEHRNVYCPAYTVCLNKAVKEGWTDWTCRRCPSFVANTKPSIASFAHARRGDAE